MLGAIPLTLWIDLVTGGLPLIRQEWRLGQGLRDFSRKRWLTRRRHCRSPVSVRWVSPGGSGRPCVGMDGSEGKG